MTRRAYPFEGITIIVPDQGDGAFEIDVVQKEIPDLPRKSNGITLIRPIANIVIKHGNQPLKSFKPPVELRVAYRYGDLAKVEHKRSELILAYYDGQKYIKFTEEDNDYLIHKPTSTTGLLAECKIHKWAGDPPIIWGR
jgi:hypothetical protein